MSQGFYSINSTTNDSVEQRRKDVIAAIENGSARTCPFCLNDIPISKLLGHNKVCMFLYEQETDSDMLVILNITSPLLKKNQKRKLDSISPDSLQNSQSSNSSQPLNANSSSSTNASQSNSQPELIFEREKYYEHPSYVKERQSKQGLCCVPATDCHIDKRNQDCIG
ncbi:hypothetical protein C9374_001142 [Naegleria lovaniensis]|uniref:Uncharacterized protein n=1 Tax=Naegleria lovaniensis TaxID=51637 RepID=A0AA88KMG6_NAELO|nr:uncharacterized protein C9374_001142 [Naegleria lovaniensis]KAG2387548.1 hypothetical protein C9374_001142 [Naegleria lovaniensis]